MAKKIIIFICLIFLIFPNLYSNVALKNNKANRLFKNGRYEDALKKYTDAQLEDPESPVLRYNIANTYYKQGLYEKAIDEYNKALSNAKDKMFESKIYYNLGNTYFRMGDYLRAIDYYKKTLDINPNDEDAKYNIEIARKRIQQNMTPQQSSSGSQNIKSQNQSESEKGATDKQEQSKEQQRKQSSMSKKDEKKMSKEDAQRLLDAFEEEEKKTQKKLKKVQGSGIYVEKDW